MPFVRVFIYFVLGVSGIFLLVYGIIDTIRVQKCIGNLFRVQKDIFFENVKINKHLPKPEKK